MSKENTERQRRFSLLPIILPYTGACRQNLINVIIIKIKCSFARHNENKLLCLENKKQIETHKNILPSSNLNLCTPKQKRRKFKAKLFFLLHFSFRGVMNLNNLYQSEKCRLTLLKKGNHNCSIWNFQKQIIYKQSPCVAISIIKSSQQNFLKCGLRKRANSILTPRYSHKLL